MASVWEHSSTRRVSGHFIHDGSRRPDTFPSSQNEAAITKFRLNREDRFLEFTAEVIVGALKENQAHGGMTRQDLRDAARLHIGNTGLLDHVLKAMNNVIVGNHVVCRTVTQSLEFWNIPSVRLVMRLTFLSRKKKHLESFLQYHLWCQVLMFTMIWLICFYEKKRYCTLYI